MSDDSRRQDWPEKSYRPEGQGFAPGSYCLRTCYCTRCPHYVPAPRPTFSKVRLPAGPYWSTPIAPEDDDE